MVETIATNLVADQVGGNTSEVYLSRSYCKVGNQCIDGNLNKVVLSHMHLPCRGGESLRAITNP